MDVLVFGTCYTGRPEHRADPRRVANDGRGTMMVKPVPRWYATLHVDFRKSGRHQPARPEAKVSYTRL
jgi:hypothetical protein